MAAKWTRISLYFLSFALSRHFSNHLKRSRSPCSWLIKLSPAAYFSLASMIFFLRASDMIFLDLATVYWGRKNGSINFAQPNRGSFYLLNKIWSFPFQFELC